MSELASSGQLRMSFVRVALFTVPLILFLGILSGVVAGSGYDNAWFSALDKPSTMPPGWVFAFAWTILYILIGLALALVIFARGATGRGAAIGLFVVQFALNLTWSPLFFAMHRIGTAFMVILAMLVLSIVTALAFARIRRTAGLLMLPYIAWLCFAAWLNHEIGVLNPNGETLAPASVSTQVEL